jgi:ketosteroid isomerase-like protein
VDDDDADVVASRGRDLTMEKLSADEEAVRAAVVRFYDALEGLVCGRGTEAMKDAWHHTPRVTAAHPLGDWSYGWDEILATWEVVAGFGAPESGGSSIRDLRVHVYGGDLAYATCVFTSGPRYGSATVSCTNVLHRAGGAWKLVHHHADKSQKIEQTMTAIAEGSAPTG